MRTSLLETTISADLSLTQIKERIASIKMKSVGDLEGQPPSLKSRVDATYAKVKKLKLWDDPIKHKQLDKLLRKLEALVSED